MSEQRTVWNFRAPPRIVFGRGAVREVGPVLKSLGGSRILIVADRALVQAGIVDRVERALTAAGLERRTFDGGVPEPAIAVAEAALDFARADAPDAVLGVGGGSNMDLAKIVAAALTHGGGPRDFFGVEKVPGPLLPLVCVPTTAGTGSEVSHAAVLTDTANQIKVSTLSQFLRPAVAAVDPELTLSCPPKATADSGIDALTHAIEAYVATDFRTLTAPPGDAFAYEGKHPLGDGLAEQAVKLIGRHLRQAVREPHDIAAREGMSLAALLAGLAFSNCGVAAVHALEYPLGGAVHVSHGAGNGLLLPHVMRFELPVRSAEFARIAAWLGEDTTGLDEMQAAERAIAAVDRLRDAIGVPARIRDLGAREDQLPLFADKAFALTRLMLLTPRRPTRDDLLQIYRHAF